MHDLAKKLGPQPTTTQGKTDAKTTLLKNLAAAQKERLSQLPPFSLAHVSEASEHENILGESLVLFVGIYLTLI